MNNKDKLIFVIDGIIYEDNEVNREKLALEMGYKPIVISTVENLYKLAKLEI